MILSMLLMRLWGGVKAVGFSACYEKNGVMV
jgi:hypothetical protein